MFNFEGFPVPQLGRMLESVVTEIHRETGAPVSSIATALLATLSLVCQGRIRVRKRHGLISPTSLWFIAILGSGELKTAILNKMLVAVDEFVAEQNQAHASLMSTYEAELQSWKAEGKGIQATIRKKSAASEPIDEDQARLQEHASRQPKKPKRFKLRHERMSPQALLKNLSECHPTTSLTSDEAAYVFSSRAMSDMGMLNKAFDGSDLIADRSTDGELVARNPCLPLALYVQPEVLDAFFKGKGELARVVGLLARCYVIKPWETAGYRTIAYSATASDAALRPFYARCKEILNSHIGDDPTELRDKIELPFADDAQRHWEAEHDRIQVMMRPGGLYENDKDFAAKLADKIARLAAILHFFEGGEGPIPLATLERSIVISEWYGREFVRHFAKPVQLPQEQVDANNLLIWFANYIRVTNLFFIKKTELRQGAPNQMRNIVRLNAALRVLWSRGYVAEGKPDNEKSVYVFLNQQLFTPEHVRYLCSQPSQ